MRGEFCGVRAEILDEIFLPLQDLEDVDDSLFLDVLRDTVSAPKAPVAPVPLSLNEEGQIYLPGDIEAFDAYKQALARYQEQKEAFNDASSQEDLAWEYLRSFYLDPETSEAQLVKALEGAFEVVDDFGGGELSNAFFGNVEAFMEKYSLRYDLRRPFSLHPTLPGIFSRLVSNLRDATASDPDLAELMHEFEESVRDLKSERTPRKIKQCISAQFNILEALLQKYPDVAEHNRKVDAHNATASRSKQRKHINTFGAMCAKADVCPHDEVLNSAKSIYKFASDYPGLRHGGTPASRKREIDMRDMVAMTVVLAGFTPYLTDLLNADAIFAE
ncbi:hypothetical protein [Thalassobius sp. Cn5-15]|uniref:hypothetical protein n=1 Tax=Thalassobius sp. Cn5-15 TaxID=2917763 RepID=UPI001EF2F39A|nr:hypothetical protein [Thalassobius sp. Cn5-15]MCG7495199.1 hypothetical protein [Thalassobius sp. Cn5-15]